MVALKQILGRVVSENSTQHDPHEIAYSLFVALSNPQIADDAALPKTGVAIERERLLSSAFIRIAADENNKHGAPSIYGTRCSTVVIAEQTDTAKRVHVFERVFNSDGTVGGDTNIQFEVV